MTKREVELLAQQGESETVELKRSTGQLTRAGETLCAFLNCRGGRVLIGVAPNGQALGQKVADSTMQDVAQILRRFEPPAPIGIDRIPIDPEQSTEVLILAAPPNAEGRPYTFDHRVYERIGTTTSVMPQDSYRRLLLERLHAHQRWENAPAPVTIDDLDLGEIRRTLRSGAATGRVTGAVTDDPADILERLGLQVQGQLLNAAVVVFGRHFLPHYPQCQLRLARFRGRTKTEFVDQRQTHGHAFELLEQAMQFLSRHLPVAGRVEPGVLERVDEPLFPPVALREALVNAFCHRDYSLAGGAVSVALYDDRLEIWSDGTLPFGLTVADLKQDHLSRPRNPLISETFYRRGLVERWGRGTQRIVELCVAAGHPEPEFVEQAGAVGVRFVPSGYVAPLRVDHDLTERQRKVLHVLAGRNVLSFGEIRAEAAPDTPERTLRDDMGHLKRLGLIGSRGRGRYAVWFLQRDTNKAE